MGECLLNSARAITVLKDITVCYNSSSPTSGSNDMNEYYELDINNANLAGKTVDMLIVFSSMNSDVAPCKLTFESANKCELVQIGSAYDKVNTVDGVNYYLKDNRAFILNVPIRGQKSVVNTSSTTSNPTPPSSSVPYLMCRGEDVHLGFKHMAIYYFNVR